ncbi:hypothetical protein FLAG1_01954 [Fusarium langsethiae]|uniref:Uncharacterized protein n=1 Tax=Fusarium langsethiae TaxID=179993 RepID=A0A0M9F335_FUSLA|nr:hypothetical protein FLAG1_01954 [Fusarium langsethiae]GKT99212.1 unnamed protein product [Fusarium langsethiae]GKU17052.1 unnamed protein product [Fusarium langsethiae]
MLWRQSLRRTGPCLARPSTTPLAIALPIYGPPLTAVRPAVVGRQRWLASIKSLEPTTTSTAAAESYTQSDRHLDELLRAIRCKETENVFPAFHAWVMLLANDDLAAHEQIRTLPANVLSAVIRALDPIHNPQIDVAHGLNISLGQIQFTNACNLVDEFGVRRHHVFVLEAMKLLLKARRSAGRELVLADYEVFLRCAGAAGDIAAAMFFFGAIREHGLAPKRTTTTWNEFLKARYQMNPAYYQFDRQRVLLKARDSYRVTFRTILKNVRRIETLRHSMNALKEFPFNRQRHRLWADNFLWQRQKMGFQSYFAHWRRSRAMGVLLNEELLCSTLIGLGRSGSLTHIRSIVLKKGLGIGLLEDKETGIFSIIGRRSFRPGNPKAPTERFLNAMVEAFGCMSRICLCLDLVIHTSNVYHIPIPHETWNNLFNWAYVCSTKSNQAQRKILESFPPSALVDAQLVTKVWETMTSAPYNVEPTFESYIARIKVLIFQRRFGAAREMIRDHAIKHYRSLEKEHQQIVFDEVLQEVSHVSHRRLTIETQKEHAWYAIQECVHRFFSDVTSNANRRNSKYPQTVVPNIILEFSEFMTEQIRYRAAQGYVCLERSVQPRRYKWVKRNRQTLPQLKGGFETQMLAMDGKIAGAETFEDRMENWPRDEVMNVREWKRVPNPRLRAKGAPPESTDVNAREWWNTLAGELMR